MDKKAHYEQQLALKQRQLALLQQAMGRQQKPAILVLEGADTAGKGGIIRRLGWCLDPRWLHVWPTSAPDEHERQQHWLQRFWHNIPQAGHFAVFDRSWYGRVLVERVEGYASQAQWQRAYSQINQFEQCLTDEGFALVKVWLDISPDTQLKRFQERLADPAKRWKLTAEDIRNRRHADAYQAAVKDMLASTHSAAAPWHVIDGNDKHQARLEVFDLLLQRLSVGVDLTPPAAPAEVVSYLNQQP